MAFNFDKFKKGLIKIGLKETDYYDQLTGWVEAHGNSENTKKDFFWNLYQTLLSSVGIEYSHDPQLMYRTQRSLYCEMFAFLCEEKKNIYPAQKGINNCDLQLAALIGLKMNAIIIGGNRCDEAKLINSKIFPLEVMLQQSILPYEKCTRVGGCICCYGFEGLRDYKGKLIRKDE